MKGIQKNLRIIDSLSCTLNILWIIDLSLILFNYSGGIHLIPKESKYTTKFLSKDNETQCVSFLFFFMETYYARTILYFRQIVTWKHSTKLRFIHEIICNLDIVQRMEWNYKFWSICSLPALLTLLPLIPFTTEEITGCNNEAAKGANKSPRYPPSCFFISWFTVSVTPSINTS